MKDKRLEDEEWKILRNYYGLTPEEIYTLLHGDKITNEIKEKIENGIKILGVEEDNKRTISEFYAYPLVELIRRKRYEELKNIAENIGDIRIIGAPLKEDVPAYLRKPEYFKPEYFHVSFLHLILPLPETEIRSTRVYEIKIDKEGVHSRKILS